MECSDASVDAWLAPQSTPLTVRDNSDSHKLELVVDEIGRVDGATRVALARVLAAIVLAGANLRLPVFSSKLNKVSFIKKKSRLKTKYDN
jgi:hypothetical protein